MNNQDYYNKEYVPQVNKIGKITGYLGVLLSFTPALVLAVVYGILPKPAALLTAFISGANAFGVLWFGRPQSLTFQSSEPLELIWHSYQEISLT